MKLLSAGTTTNLKRLELAMLAAQWRNLDRISTSIA
jgi:hypothetical protein